MMNRLHPQRLTLTNKLMRLLWRTVWVLLFRPSPQICHWWRRFLLRIFGAKVGRGTFIYPSAQVWAPWNLSIGDHSCLSHFVDCYCVDKVIVGNNATVSQYSYLCTASHDYNSSDMPLISAPITIGNYAWVTADVFVGPGVTIGEGAVLGARCTVIKDISPWSVVAGAPLRIVAERDRSQFL